MRKQITFALLVSLGTAFNSTADVVKPRLKACTVDWPPYTIIDPTSKKITGTEPDALRLVSKEIGYEEAEIVTVSWNRCLKEAEEGKMDLVITATKSPEREAFLNYVDASALNTAYVFLANKTDTHNWNEKKDVSQLPKGQYEMPVVGSPEGYSVTKELASLTGIKLDTGAKDDAQNLKKFQLGRVTTILGAKDVLSYCLKKEGKLDTVNFLEPAFNPGKTYFLTVSKKFGGSLEASQALTEKLNAAYEKIRTDGQYKAINAKYTG